MEKIIDFVTNNIITDNIAIKLYIENIHNYNIIKYLIENNINGHLYYDNKLIINYCNYLDIFKLIYYKYYSMSDEYKEELLNCNNLEILKFIIIIKKILYIPLLNSYSKEIITYILNNFHNSSSFDNDIEKAKILLKNGRELKIDDYRENNNHDIIKLLIENKIEIPKFILFYIDCPKLAEIYLNNGININYTDKYNKNALFYSKNVKYIKYLVSKDINLYQKDINNDTVLIHYIKNTSTSTINLCIVNLYISYGLDINDIYKCEKHIIYDIYDNFNILEQLIQMGLNVFIDEIIMTYIVSKNYNIELLLKKYDVNTQNEEGNTILHILCKKFYYSKRFKEISNLLIKHYNANVYITNNDNLTACDLLDINILDDELIKLYTEVKSDTKSANKII